MVEFVKMETVRNHVRAGWVVRFNGEIVGPRFDSRKQARVWANLWLKA